MRVDVSPVGERLELEANPGLGFENIDVGLPIPGGFEEVHGVAGHQVAEVQSQFQVVIELVLHVAVDFHAEVLLFECQPFQIFGRLKIKLSKRSTSTEKKLSKSLSLLLSSPEAYQAV